MAGYSGNLLYKKLGIKENFKLYIKNAPPNYEELISPIPVGVTIKERLSNNMDIFHNSGSDLSIVISKVEAAGGKVEMFKTVIGAHGFVGIFHDTEGNRVGLHSPG